MKKIDYSSEAISRRLRQTEQLRVLSLSLIRAKEAHDKKIEKEGIVTLQADRIERINFPSDAQN